MKIAAASIALTALVLAIPAAPAAAADLRPFCATRPSLGSTACIVDAGHAMLEVGVADWEREDDGEDRTDTLVGGDLLMRYGIGARTEVQLGWTVDGYQRFRSAATGARTRQDRIGDVRIAVRQNIAHPDNAGFSIAVQPFVTVPVGRQPIGAGTWGAGAIIPVGYAINDMFQVQFTAEVDDAPDEDGAGHHRAVSGIGGLAVQFSDTVSATGEIYVARDDDPEGHATTVLAALSGGYMLSDRFQIDGGSAVGLNAASADVRLFVGFSRRF